MCRALIRLGSILKLVILNLSEKMERSSGMPSVEPAIMFQLSRVEIEKVDLPVYPPSKLEGKFGTQITVPRARVFYMTPSPGYPGLSKLRAF